ncbi:MAG: translocation/assembly module TamB domain-containing protein [Cyclobacteriaceae bacterium]
MANYISEQIGHQTSINYINIKWFDVIVVKGLQVLDTQSEEMILVENLVLDFKLRELFFSNTINFDRAELEGAVVSMRKNSPTEDFNINYFISRIQDLLPPKEDLTKGAKPFAIDEVYLSHSKFSLDNTGRDSLNQQFDHNHFVIQNIRGGAKNLLISAGDFELNAENLRGTEMGTGLEIKNLKTLFKFTKRNMVFENLELIVGNTSIKNSMVFAYDSVKSLSEFVDEVEVTAHFRQSILNSQDLGAFIPALKNHNQNYRLKGYFEGHINRFNTKNLVVEFGLSSRLEGDISMMGFPSIKETFVIADLTAASINANDLQPYVDDTAMKNISKFGQVNIKGGFTGFFSDFVCNASFRTAVGNFTTDINLKINEEDQEKSTYSGRLVTESLNLGELIDDSKMLQMLDLEGKLDGKGVSLATAEINLDATIHRIGIKGYDYQEIYTNAKLARELFEGSLAISDPNLYFNGTMNVDLRKDFEKIQINAQLDSANLLKMKLTDNHSFVSARMDVDIQGLKPDEMIGTASFLDFYFEYKDQWLEMDTLELHSSYDSLGRSVRMFSPLLDGHIFGDFKFASLITDFNQLFGEYLLALENDEESLENYYAQKTSGNEEYFFLDFGFDLKNANPVINLFVPQFKITENTYITGSYTGGKTSFINLSSNIRQFSYNEYIFRRNELRLNTSKSNDSRMIYGNLHFYSERQAFLNQPRSQEFNLDLDWYEQQLNFYTRIDEYQGNSYLKVTGALDFLPNELLLSFNPSELGVIGKIWHFSDDNKVSIKKRRIEFKDLIVFNEDQQIAINGVVSEDPEDNLRLTIDNFYMENLNPLMRKSLEGIANGNVDLNNYYALREINSELSIDNFSINQFLVGDLSINSSYDTDDEHFNLDINAMRDGFKTIAVSGLVIPSAKKDQLQLTAKLVETRLNILEPFFDTLFSNIEGTTDGEMQITGRLASPEISGSGKIKNGKIMFNYLKTTYNIEGNLDFDSEDIFFRNLRLSDQENNRGTLNGTINHGGFNTVSFDLTSNFNGIRLMSTGPNDNDLFYGTAYGTGNVKITGTQDNIVISTSAKTKRGTRIFIPLEGTSEVVQQDFIQFVTPVVETDDEDDDLMPVSQSKNEPARITMNFDLDITPDAYCEIIFDITAGDIIRGRGEGKLNMQYDSRGVFQMFGEYEINEGAYNFTLRNIINKEFAILPGSRITWLGDPYAAILDIRASYRQLASLQPILNLGDVETQSPDLNRKYPAFVMMDIKGNLDQPNISFDISIEEYPKNLMVEGISLEAQVGIFKNRIANDEQELKRQVFSLIILRNFSPQDAFNVSGTVGNSLSEFISNQVSYWVNQVDENLLIDLDLGSLNQEAFNTFQLRLSYSFLDGRLRVTRDGGLYNERNPNEASSIIGDWMVEYMLTADGKYRVKVYSKSQFNTIYSNIDNRNITTTGFSLMHTQSFNELRDIFKSSRKKLEETKEKEGPVPADEDEDNPYILPSEAALKNEGE